MKNKKEELDKRFLEDFGMTYDEFDSLDLHTQLELISKKKDNLKKKKKKIKVMIGSGDNAIFIRVPKDKKVMLSDGTVIRAGQKDKKQDNLVKRLVNKIKKH